jgi:hypothetical protein
MRPISGGRRRAAPNVNAFRKAAAMRQTLSLVFVVVHVMKHADHLMAEEIDLPTVAAKKAK